MKIIFIILFAICMFFAGKLFGQTTGSSIAVSGFVDTYYSKNFNHPSSRSNALRNFDIAENQFTLSLAEIVLQKKASPVGFRMDLDYGTANDVVQPGNGSTLSVLQQGYLTAILPIGEGLTVDVGKFTTHMGYEVIESKDNWNYSRSLLFAWAVPYYHTGIRLSYPVADNITTTVHVVNGWNSVSDNNNWKSVGATVNFALSSSSAVILNVLSGSEDLILSPTLYETGKKNVVDIIVTHQLTEVVAMGVNADYGEARTNQGLELWKGAALYGRYTLDQTSALAIRAEIFDDPKGYATGIGALHLDVKEVTGTYEYRFAEELVFRCEARCDFSNSPIFMKNTLINPERNQPTALVGVVATF